MKLLVIIIIPLCLFLSTSIFATPSKLVGSWKYIEKGEDFKNTKSCELRIDGRLNCVIEEMGYSGRVGEAHKYISSGKWTFNNEELTFIELVFENKIVSKYKLLKINEVHLIVKTEQNTIKKWVRF